jgi:hypothetical protein
MSQLVKSGKSQNEQMMSALPPESRHSICAFNVHALVQGRIGIALPFGGAVDGSATLVAALLQRCVCIALHGRGLRQCWSLDQL